MSLQSGQTGKANFQLVTIFRAENQNKNFLHTIENTQTNEQVVNEPVATTISGLVAEETESDILQ